MLRPHVFTCVCHVRNQSLTNVKVYIYVQVAHVFDTFYTEIKLKFGMIFNQIKTLDFMVEFPLGLAPRRGQGSESITNHIEHMQNDNRLLSLEPLLALELLKSGIMIPDEIVLAETRVWKLDHARGGAVG